eukprot:m51a1_g1617 putative glycosyl hydrolases 31 family protein (869) ;mRNA; r:217912-221125
MDRLLLLVATLFVAAQSADNPAADPKAIVTFGHARFTVLTESVVRIEWSDTGVWDDLASLVFLNRLLPVPQFWTERTSTSVMIKTPRVSLSYTPGNEGQTVFSAANLKIDVCDATAGTWRPGTKDTGNLFGTLRTLDNQQGPEELDCSLNPHAGDLYCTYGLVSRGGWALVDDSATRLIDRWLVGERNDRIDWYFFGHGLDYRKALAEFTLIAGKIPLPPRYAFGIYFSRGTKAIVEEYVAHNTPLDVVVTDMDWHQTFYKEAEKGQLDPAGQMIGWTGHTWDKGLFPQPQNFLAWCKRRGLRNTLNLHPASGLQKWEERFEEVARAMGMDPSQTEYVPYDLQNETFARAYLDLVLQPLTDQGIDFWWLDWQQWLTGNPNPTFWLNHVFFNNHKRRGENLRGMILHRWGGLGNHRYQVGFSGDVIPSWSSLAFQPYFTSTASNVLYGYWSHDLGGHMTPVEPELYTRWVQWGAWSPIFRNHCTKDPNNDRRMWVYPLRYFMAMRSAAQYRSQLIPYIYTQARLAYDTAVSLVHPLYYDWPEEDNAYNYSKEEYLFGSDFLVAPVVSAVDPVTQLSTKNIWIPAGTWVETSSGNVFTGPQTLQRQYALEEIPVFVRAGSVIPTLPQSKPLLGSAQRKYSSLVFTVYPAGGAVRSGSTSVYEDDGLTSDYESGASTSTDVAWTLADDRRSMHVAVSGAAGGFQGQPTRRTYRVSVVGVLPPSSVTIDGAQASFDLDSDDGPAGSWTYDGNSLTLSVWAPAREASKPLAIDVSWAEEVQPLPGWTRCLWRLQRAKEVLDQQWGHGAYPEDYTQLLIANEAGERVNGAPGTAKAEYSAFAQSLKSSYEAISNNYLISENTRKQVQAYIMSCW